MTWTARLGGSWWRLLGGYNSTVEEADIVKRINTLVGEYRNLERQHGGLGLTAEQRKTLVELQAEIDHSWEQLRQRRARRHAGEGARGVFGRPAPALESAPG